MNDERPRLLILGACERETLAFAARTDAAGWSSVDWASLERPRDLFRQIRRAAGEPAGQIVHCLSPVCAYLAASTLPRSVAIIASGVETSEYPWNRWLRQRVAAFWEQTPPQAKAPSEEPGEFPLWGFGDWTSRSGVREILWAFTMIRTTGWKCRLHLFGRGAWQKTLRQFADLASMGPQIEFHPCYPDQLAGRRLPALIFSPQPQNLPAWLTEHLGETEILTSAKSPAMQGAGNGLRLTPITWKPAVMATNAMRILGASRDSGVSFTRTLPDSILWDQAGCYSAIRRHLRRNCA